MDKKLFWLFALSSGVYFAQGIEGLPSQSLFYYFKETLGFSPEKIMLITSFTISAWLIKPMIGYVIDSWLSKKAWIFIALSLDIICVLCIGLFSLPVFFLVVVLLFNATNAAFRDVSVDGMMCVQGKEFGITGKIQSIQWIAITISGLMTGICGGYIAEKLNYRAGYMLLIPFYLLVGLTAFFYKPLIAETRPKSSFLTDMKKVLGDKRLILVGVFIFLYKYSPSFGTPLFFVQRDQFKWDKIWIGYFSAIGAVFEVTGALIYFKLSKRINIKKWLYISIFLGAVTTLSYLYYTPVTAVIYNILYGVLGMFIFLMVMDFMARNTAKGLEATSFALLCSFSNLALVASNLSGAFLLPILGLKPLIVISALTSFLCLPLIKKI
ncbi:MAG: MFS transporter [Candidatus Omnitrophica bacterium]|jgi:MFS family permease|nr:MFS transporter [Candidatus Omnitrophota bacterium]